MADCQRSELRGGRLAAGHLSQSPGLALARSTPALASRRDADDRGGLFISWLKFPRAQNKDSPFMLNNGVWRRALTEGRRRHQPLGSPAAWLSRMGWSKTQLYSHQMLSPHPTFGPPSPPLFVWFFGIDLYSPSGPSFVLIWMGLLCCVVLHCVALCCVVLRCVALCCVALHFVVLLCALLRCWLSDPCSMAKLHL